MLNSMSPLNQALDASPDVRTAGLRSAQPSQNESIHSDIHEMCQRVATGNTQAYKSAEIYDPQTHKDFGTFEQFVASRLQNEQSTLGLFFPAAQGQGNLVCIARDPHAHFTSCYKDDKGVVQVEPLNPAWFAQGLSGVLQSHESAMPGHAVPTLHQGQMLPNPTDVAPDLLDQTDPLLETALQPEEDVQQDIPEEFSPDDPFIRRQVMRPWGEGLYRGQIDYRDPPHKTAVPTSNAEPGNSWPGKFTDLEAVFDQGFRPKGKEVPDDYDVTHPKIEGISHPLSLKSHKGGSRRTAFVSTATDQNVAARFAGHLPAAGYVYYIKQPPRLVQLPKDFKESASPHIPPPNQRHIGTGFSFPPGDTEAEVAMYKAIPGPVVQGARPITAIKEVTDAEGWTHREAVLGPFVPNPRYTGKW